MTSTISNDVNGVKTTFSSWDACMQKTYCKYPAIIGIVIGSLIVLSIVFCIARCLCCGVECCCACCSCFNACCPSPRGRNRGSKYNDGPPQSYQPSPYQGYQPNPAPPVYNNRPQYAQFDASTKRGNEDTLPAMPSWDNASSKKVPDDDMELGRLNPVDEARNPLLANKAPSPHLGYQNASAGLPYQQHVAQQGGDLGSPYGQQDQVYGGAGGQRPYAGQRSPNSYGGSPVRQPQNSGFTSPPQHTQAPAYRTNSPYQQPSYSAYAPSDSGSTRYEPSTTYNGQESGFAYNSRPPPSHQPYSGGVPAALRPAQDNTWRDV